MVKKVDPFSLDTLLWYSYVSRLRFHTFYFSKKSVLCTVPLFLNTPLKYRVVSNSLYNWVMSI